MEGKTRFPDFLLSPLQGVVVSIASGAQVGSVQRSIWTENFCIANGKCCAFLSTNPQAEPADHVLAQIENPTRIDEVRNLMYIYGPQFFLAFYCRSICGNQRSTLVGKNLRRPPECILVARRTPIC